MNQFIYSFFLFVNVFNPVSPLLTVFINILIALCINRNNSYGKKEFVPIFYISFIILIWLLIVFLLNDLFSFFLFAKYLRIIISLGFVAYVTTRIDISVKHILNSYSLILFIQFLTIGLQTIFPSLVIPIAQVFNFDRDLYLLELLDQRNLGLANSYDFAALLSVIGIYLFYLQYNRSQNIFFLLLFLISFLTCFRVSRMAMIFGILVFAILSLRLLQNSKFINKIIISIVLLIAGYAGVLFGIPVLFGSLSIFKNTDFNKGYVISTANYSKSDESLINNHLFFPKNFNGLFFGEGVDMKNSDIGYVKIIFAIGIIGLLLIIYQYFYMLRKVYIYGSLKKISYFKDLSNLFVFSTAALFVSNIKILLLYSRGAHEFILILFFSIVRLHIKNKIVSPSLYVK